MAACGAPRLAAPPPAQALAPVPDARREGVEVSAEPPCASEPVLPEPPIVTWSVSPPDEEGELLRKDMDDLLRKELGDLLRGE